MIRPIQLLALLTLVLADPGSLGANPGADEALDIEYAEDQPLVVESVLLDVAKIGNRLVAVGERGHVLFSNDGATWKQAEHVPTRSTLTTVVAVGDRLWAGGHDAVIITSGDRGNTWSRQYFEPDRQQAVMDFNFTDENNGVAIGSYGLKLETNDGGKHWTDGVVDAENEFHLNGMVRFDDRRRIIAGEAGYSYRSFDDGLTWEPIDLPYQGSMWGAIRTSEECVVFYGLRGHVMESCDFGASWVEIETDSQSSLSDAVMLDEVLVLVGNSGELIMREDGQVTRHVHSSGVDFAAVIALEDGRLLLFGEDGVHYFPEADAEGSSP
jgi:photosystem II stability/assembly factor-like uncharacterized protein